MQRAIYGLFNFMLESSPLAPVVSQAARKTTNVIHYHFVGNPGPHYQPFFTGCTLARFEEDLKLLNRVFEFAPLEEVVARRPYQSRTTRPTLAVTFDDGLKIATPQILDLLRRYRISATAFLITACVNNQHLMWRHLLGAVQSLVPEDVWKSRFNRLAKRHGFGGIPEDGSLLGVTRDWDCSRKDIWGQLLWKDCGLMPIEEYLGKEQPYFTWGDVKDWLAAGHSIGFHTHTHPFCSKLSREDLEKEIVEPAQELVRRLGLKDIAFSYPFGAPLQPELERELVQRKTFTQLFGVRGFSRKGSGGARLERAGAEDGSIGLRVFARALLPY
jgi:peptidoglycan/xylan/chitin deacetylase (PgdA/CDA1 family)